MRPISNKVNDTIIQIEATNLCNRSCSNCVRFCGHYRKEKIFYVELNNVIKYLKALDGFAGYVGLIGGEPTLHPKFMDLCKIMQDYRGRARCGIWTNCLTPQFKEHRKLIEETFFILNYNKHDTNITHTPILVASGEVVSDELERKEFNDNCWLQNTWSANITPKGAYFCEVAGMLSWLYDGPDGWDATDPEWWKKGIPEYAEQADWACRKCGAALPLFPRPSKDIVDDVSSEQLKNLAEIRSPKALAIMCEIYNKGFLPGQDRTREWYRNK